MDRLRPALGDRPIVVNVPDDLPPVLVDAALLDDVISNLIDNAVEARTRAAPPPGPRRRRTVRPASAIVVEDGGPGVPESALVGLFDRPIRLAPTAAMADRRAWASACLVV